MGKSSAKDFQAVANLVIVYAGGDHENGNRLEFYRGERIPADELGDADRDRYLEAGAIRPWGEKAELPGANEAAAAPILTQPNGEPLELAPDAEIETGFKAARTHAEADAMAADLGVTFPDGTKLDAKNEALQTVSAGRAAGEPTATATTEDLSEFSDEELIQRGIDYGHTEEEMEELGHDELVLFVAEAMNRQGSTVEAQEASVAERDANETQTPPAPDEG